MSLSLSLCTALAGLCPPFGRAGDMNKCMYVRMYVCMYVCKYLSNIYLFIYLFTYVRTYARMHAMSGLANLVSQ